jgi:DNA-binding beta-propeller fold protein YncE
VLTAPGCTSKAAVPRALPHAGGRTVQVGGRPSDVVVTSRGYGFVALTSALGVLQISRRAPTLMRTIQLPAVGLTLTHDQKYLLVTGPAGVTVFGVSDLEQGLSAPLGTLTSPGSSGAVQVALTPDDKYAFVALRSGGSGHVAVFNLRRALKNGPGHAHPLGLIPVAARPAGITVAPDGDHIYVTSGLATSAGAPGQGWLTVIDTFRAEASPPASVLKVVKAGCGPDRIVISKTSQQVWVTVNGGNALVAYSAARLLTDPGHAIIARVPVGQRPLGAVIFDHGKRILVADSGAGHASGGLALVSVPKALAHQPALLGSAATGAAPCAVILYPGGQTLLAADSGTGTLRAISVASLP